jgi:hypothetical protein
MTSEYIVNKYTLREVSHLFKVSSSFLPFLCIYYKVGEGVEGAVRGLEGTHPADTCILTKLE